MGLKVLLIDDSQMMRRMILRALRQAEVDVTETHEASNGQEGLEALAAHAPDLVLCDWNMPVMDGLEFVKQSQASSPAPVIMLTTEATSERVAQARDAGAKGYVTKPFTPEKLGAAIVQALDR